MPHVLSVKSGCQLEPSRLYSKREPRITAQHSEILVSVVKCLFHDTYILANIERVVDFIVLKEWLTLGMGGGGVDFDSGCAAIARVPFFANLTAFRPKN